jgi:hypothetical protein
VQGETLRVESSSRGWRWVAAAFITVLTLYAVAVFAVGGTPWYMRALAVLMLIGSLPNAYRFAYAEVTREGLDLDVRVRRRHIPWAQVQEIELGGPHGRPPRVLLADGTEVKSLALGGFMAGPEADPDLVDRLNQAAETHGFTLTGQ